MKPSQVILTLEEMRSKIASRLRRDDLELSVKDHETTMSVYQQWLGILVDLGYLPTLDALKSIGMSVLADLSRRDVLLVNNAFADALHVIRHGEPDSRFKVYCSCISRNLFKLLKDDYIASTTQHDIYAAKRLMQVFSYTSRLSLLDIDLADQQIDAYLENESLIKDEFPEHLILSLNNLMRRWIGPTCPQEIKPHHGPGSIAEVEGASIQEKYQLLNTDKLLQYSFGEPWWCDTVLTEKLDRTSRTIFVPKSYKTFRTISMEPTTLMYFQQGIWDVIETLVSRDKYLRNHIGFRDQSRNRHLARIGSIDKSYATIDLSAASDSVSYSLVKKVFKGTWLLKYLVTTRSSHTILPNGEKILLKKFAPMGSALCFPVETLIFAGVCEIVTRGFRTTGRYSVFGDDMIVPQECVSSVFSILEDLGFCVNKSKSFYGQEWFRESCGGEYVDGLDVTPLRISRKYCHALRSIKVAGLIDLANNAYSLGLLNLRAIYIHELQQSGFHAIFGDLGVHSDYDTNFHLPSRWNINLQRIEYKASTIETMYTGRSKEIEELRYRHWMETCSDRKTVERAFVSVISKPSEVIKRRWKDPRGSITKCPLYYRLRQTNIEG